LFQIQPKLTTKQEEREKKDIQNFREKYHKIVDLILSREFSLE